MSKELSIIIPAYNAERFIEKQLEELVKQIGENKNACEVIVVNDGSQDSTLRIAKEFSEKYNFIVIVDQKNKGECGARNSGIEMAQGKFLYFIDADDFIEANTISYYLDIIRNYSNIDLFCFSYKSIDYDTQRLLKNYSLRKFDNQCLTKEQFLKAFYGKLLYTHVCSMVVKRDCIVSTKQYFTEGVRIGGDILFQLGLFDNVSSVLCKDRNCFIYRIRNDSIMQGYHTYSDVQFHSMELFDEYFENHKIQNKILNDYRNFYIIVHYLYNFKNYYKSDIKDIEIEKKFLHYKDIILKRKIGGVAFNKFKILITIFRFIPIKCIFMFKK